MKLSGSVDTHWNWYNLEDRFYYRLETVDKLVYLLDHWITTMFTLE